MDYGAIINRAYSLVRRSPVLWKLGLLAVFTEGMVNGIGQSMPTPQMPGGDKSKAELEWQQSLNNLDRWFDSHVGLTVAIVIAVLLLGFLLWYVSLRAKAGLITSVDDLEENKSPMSFGAAFARGAVAAGRLFRLYLLAAAAILLVMGVVFAMLYAAYLMTTAMLVVGVLLLLPAIFIFIVYTNFLMKIAERHIVLGSSRIWQGITYGHRLFVSRFANSLLALLIEFGLGILFVIAVFAVVVVAVGLGALVLLLLATVMPQAVTVVVAGALLLALVVGIFLLSGWFAAFQITYWTLVYRALGYMVGEKEKLTSKIS